MSQHTELIVKLLKFADTLTAGIMTGHDHPNSQDELDRLNSARFLREAADALQAMERVPMTEQPIEDAPKDGTAVLLCFPGLGWVRGSWDSQIHHKKPKPYWTHDCIHYMSVAHARANQPNWWMPLPTPPESKG